MTRAPFVFRIFPLLLLLSIPALPASAQDTRELIERALLPLPESLRSEAAVVNYAEPSQPTALREGTNELVCRLFSFLPRFFARCHHRELATMVDRYYALLGQGTSIDDAAEILDAEIRAGQISVNNGGTEYLLTGRNPESAELIVTITIPGATGATTGLPTEENDDQPWLMWEGTEVAHVMIPQD